MLSLPEDWDYSLKGLATLNKEGIDAIRSAINELEAFGYIERSRVRNEKGQLGENEYIIHELPISPEPKQTEPTLEIQHWIILYRLNLNRASPRN